MKPPDARLLEDDTVRDLSKALICMALPARHWEWRAAAAMPTGGHRAA